MKDFVWKLQIKGCKCVGIPVAASSKACVSGRLPVEIVGSNPTGNMDVFLVTVVCCLIEVSRRADHLSREVPPSVLFLSVIVKS